MITIFIFLLLLYFSVLAMQQFNAELIISPIMGVMLGSLYDREQDENQVYHTVQVLMLFVAFTFTWQTYE
jgi:uncharacterized membrane protein YkgB